MKDLFSFIQQAAYRTIICPVCKTRFMLNEINFSTNTVSTPIGKTSRGLHKTCGNCGNWKTQDIEDINAGNIFEL